MKQLHTNKFLIVLVLFVHISFSCFAQKAKLTSVEIIKADGSVLIGLVDDIRSDNSPEAFFYRKDENSKIEALIPEDCKSVKYGNNIYLSEKVKEEISPRKVSIMSYDPAFKFEEKQVFLQYIIKGKKSLLAYFNPDTGIQNFYIIRDNTIELLAYKTFLNEKKGKKYIRTNNKFHTQLMSYFSDCSSLTPEILKTKYSVSSLRKIFSSYHNCIGN